MIAFRHTVFAKFNGIKLIGEYDEHFSREYGFWRPYIEKVIYRYLDCGDLSKVSPIKKPLSMMTPLSRFCP